MLEFNQWYFVLVTNFFILLIVLNLLLFKPLAKIFKERDKSTKGALEEAKEMTVKREEALKKIKSELFLARQKAKKEYNILKEEGLLRQKEILSNTETEAIEMIGKARKELQSEIKKVKTSLISHIEIFADEIVEKMVKV